MHKVHSFTVPNQDGNIDITVTEKFTVLDVSVHKTNADGAAGDQVTVFNGSNAITNTIDLNIKNTAITKAKTFNVEHMTVNAGGILRVTAKKTKDVSCAVTVTGIENM